MSAPASPGLLAGFASEEALLRAVRELRARGYTRLEAYAPYAVEGLAQALGPARDWIAPSVLLGGVVGGTGMLWLQYYAAVIDYPVNIGGRPDASWPAFIPASLEMAVLVAVIAGVVAMLAGNGLPRLHHPLFSVAQFERASRDGFFVLVCADDPLFEAQRARGDLDALGALQIDEVPA
jgi:ActD protein